MVSDRPPSAAASRINRHGPIRSDCPIKRNTEEATVRQNTIGGYQGAVEVLTREDVVVAQAACRYRAEEDESATDHWVGRLHRIEPPDAVVAGPYRLRFPTGQHGDITVTEGQPGSSFTPFEG